MRDQDDVEREYEVVMNHEEQYSLWFAEREPPPGWKEVGKRGTRQECRLFGIRGGTQ
jgi:MbtH protein